MNFLQMLTYAANAPKSQTALPEREMQIIECLREGKKRTSQVRQETGLTDGSVAGTMHRLRGKRLIKECGTVQTDSRFKNREKIWALN